MIIWKTDVCDHYIVITATCVTEDIGLADPQLDMHDLLSGALQRVDAISTQIFLGFFSSEGGVEIRVSLERLIHLSISSVRTVILQKEWLLLYLFLVKDLMDRVTSGGVIGVERVLKEQEVDVV